MSQFASSVHSIMNNVFNSLLNNAFTTQNCEQIENLCTQYLSSILGSSVGGELALDVAKPLMGDVLGWITQTRQKSAQITSAQAAAQQAAVVQTDLETPQSTNEAPVASESTQS